LSGGIGDDCIVLASENQLVAMTDMNDHAFG